MSKISSTISYDLYQTAARKIALKSVRNGAKESSVPSHKSGMTLTYIRTRGGIVAQERSDAGGVYSERKIP